LSEQGVIRAELYADNNSTNNNTLFGYQGRYNQYRTHPNMVAGLMRTTPFDSWHLGRIFGSAPALNSDFVACVPTKRYLAATSEPAMVGQFGNLITAVRPLPLDAVPGLIDH